MDKRKGTARLVVVRDSGPHIIRNAEGQALGRFNLTDPLGAVPDGLAYTYDTYEQAVEVARDFPGSQPEPLR